MIQRGITVQVESFKSSSSLVIVISINIHNNHSIYGFKTFWFLYIFSIILKIKDWKSAAQVSISLKGHDGLSLWKLHYLCPLVLFLSAIERTKIPFSGETRKKHLRWPSPKSFAPYLHF